MSKAKNRGPQTQAKRKFNERKYDTITIFVPKGDKEIIKSHAKDRNMSMNEFIKIAVYGMMDSED